MGNRVDLLTITNYLGVQGHYLGVQGQDGFKDRKGESVGYVNFVTLNKEGDYSVCTR